MILPMSFFHVVMKFHLSHQDKKKFVQVLVKGEGTQRNKRLHKSPLNLQEKVYPLPNIYVEKFPIFFGNTSEDAKKHLVKFDSACDIYNVVEDDVAC
jgi:hypothetical protein